MVRQKVGKLMRMETVELEVNVPVTRESQFLGMPSLEQIP